MLRFYLDEHVPAAVAKGLRWRKIDVKSTAEAGLLGADDEKQLEFAIAESRVIFTNDADFLRMAANGREHCGIVYCHPAKSDIGESIRLLTLMNDCLEANEMKNVVEYLS